MWGDYSSRDENQKQWVILVRQSVRSECDWCGENLRSLGKLGNSWLNVWFVLQLSVCLSHSSTVLPWVQGLWGPWFCFDIGPAVFPGLWRFHRNPVSECSCSASNWPSLWFLFSNPDGALLRFKSNLGEDVPMWLGHLGGWREKIPRPAALRSHTAIVKHAVVNCRDKRMVCVQFSQRRWELEAVTGNHLWTSNRRVSTAAEIPVRTSLILTLMGKKSPENLTDLLKHYQQQWRKFIAHTRKTHTKWTIQHSVES